MPNADQDPCFACMSKNLELHGESGVFWLHCHDCGQDGSDIEEDDNG